MRKIIHVDMDCFYAAIEVRDDPHLKGQPVAVGGPAHSRGVIATCNYEARRYGVHSAMSSAEARRLCPELFIIRPNMAKYRAESQVIRRIFHQYTELVEPLSLDEAYLDTTDSTHFHNSATLIAEAIRKEIFKQTELTASAGVASNKLLAKIASDWNKPDGLKVVLPEEALAFIECLPVKKLHGVGKVMANKLEQMGVTTCRDLRRLSLVELVQRFGKTGKYLFDVCRGVDNRQVCPSSPRKSVSVETTFSEDIEDWSACEQALLELVSDLSRRLQKAANDKPIRKVSVKVKLNNFQIHTAESISEGLDVRLLLALLKRLREQYPQPIRLLGVGVKFPDAPSHQAEQLAIPF